MKENKILIRNLDNQLAFSFMKDEPCQNEHCNGVGFIQEFFGDLHVCEVCKGSGLEYRAEGI